MIIWRILIDILFLVGIFFMVAGVVGMLRMPDTYCRLQASTNIATMGSIPICVACAIYGFVNGNTSLGIKAIVIIVFLIITNPVASYYLAKIAHKKDAEMYNKTVCDDYGRDEINE